MSKTPSESAACDYPGCLRPRARHSVFCDEHHRQQLDRAGPGADLRPIDHVRLVIGPLWLNVTRIALTVAATLALDERSATVSALTVALSTAAIGWRWSRRLFWQPQLGFPIAFIPSLWFIIPLALYAMALCILVVLLTRTIMRFA